MRMRSKTDKIRSILSKEALKSTNAMYNVRLCSLHFSIICRRAKKKKKKKNFYFDHMLFGPETYN